MSSIIEVRNLSKSYIISHEGKAHYKTLRDVMTRHAKNFFSVHRTLNNQDPGKEEFWALKDVNFEIKQGERVGIIGRNGAGKSTLLKILSRITEPTSGNIKIKGRVASLLEVGTGFHPELSGRENIFLNGAILGMTRLEIKKHFDEIVDFAEIEKFLDTPVKRYSSGMYVRLAFAVAAHLEPEILVVDEVLAVGDAEFQKKCLGKMEDVSKNQGRTVLFVSHNLGVINTLCNRAVLLKNGSLISNDTPDKVISEYMYYTTNEGHNHIILEDDLSKSIQIKEAKLVLEDDSIVDSAIDIPEKYFLKILFKVHKFIRNAHFTFEIKDAEHRVILFADKTDEKGSYESVLPGLYGCKIEIPNPLFNKGRYYLTIGCMDNDEEENNHVLPDVFTFEVADSKRFRTYPRPGNVFKIFNWNFNRIN
ncbi:MAG: transporter related [Chitinophagaceae bacterium]|nr:transporter related [Chitinophagaceae bacterium]